MGLVRITSWYPNLWKPFWLSTQQDPQNDWTATQNRVNYDVFAQAPLQFLSFQIKFQKLPKEPKKISK